MQNQNSFFRVYRYGFSDNAYIAYAFSLSREWGQIRMAKMGIDVANLLLAKYGHIANMISKHGIANGAIVRFVYSIEMRCDVSYDFTLRLMA